MGDRLIVLIPTWSACTVGRWRTRLWCEEAGTIGNKSRKDTHRPCAVGEVGCGVSGRRMVCSGIVNGN